jgi:hypothetical protein
MSASAANTNSAPSRREANQETEVLVADNHPKPADSVKSVPLLQSGYITTARIILYFLGGVAALSVVLTATIIVLTIFNAKGQPYTSYVPDGLESYTAYTMTLVPSLIMVPSLIVIDGDCSSVRIYNVLAHFILNAIGTLVLGASNYLQQICTSPTAKQVDQLHGNIKFGSNMPGELFKRSGWQMKLFWILLISTSIPIL